MMMKLLSTAAIVAMLSIGTPAPAQDLKLLKLDPAIERLLKYTVLQMRHRLTGLASYYSNSLDGTLTANGEIYRKKRLTAAHRTLPLGCWVEVKSKATGKKIRLRVNDRGPYSRFVIDLSRSAARALGVDVAEDRSVLIRIIALPGERPLPEDEFISSGDCEAEGASLAGGRVDADTAPVALPNSLR
jgi:rare lipoprotein A